jgi:hypothetical protein
MNLLTSRLIWLTLLLALSVAGTEVTPAAATVISSAHYQARVVADTCSGGVCIVRFQAVPRRHQLNTSRISCSMNATTGSSFLNGQAEIDDEASNPIVQEFIVQVLATPSGTLFTMNQAIDLQVRPSQVLSVGLSVSGVATFAACTLTGTMDTLQ